jgi:hypothetical protein
MRLAWNYGTRAPLLMMEIDGKEIVEASCTGVGALLHACFSGRQGCHYVKTASGLVVHDCLERKHVQE